MADFDISPEELPIFLAEADENLQALDEILILLEKEHENEEYLQTAFRAAHTLKGMAGMINHERMVAVTHALETIFDGLRKKGLAVTSRMIDECLGTVDSLRALRGEVETSAASDVDVEGLVSRLGDLMHQERVNVLIEHLEPAVPPAAGAEPLPAVISPAASREEPLAGAQAAERDFIPLRVEIAPKSVASAARAFQVVMALQELGEIVSIDPSLEVIDSAVPVRQMNASLKTTAAPATIRKKILEISEIEHLQLGWDEIREPENTPEAAQTPENAIDEKNYEMLGDHLVKRQIITNSQLQSLLFAQKNSPDKKLLGKLLVEQGLVSHAQLNEEIIRMIQDQKSAAAPNGNGNGAAAKKAVSQEMTVRTSVTHLNALLNLVGELITDRNHLFQLRNRLAFENAHSRGIEELAETVTHLGRITDQLQEEVLSIRMLPVSNVFSRFPRLVRDLSHKMNKKIELVIHGEETELDRSVIDEINDPIIHMLRNSIDHGIEEPSARLAAGKPENGTILLSAEHEQGHIIITVKDDGKGIDTQALRKSAVSKGVISQDEAERLSEEEAVNLIFASGLSTSSKVSDISGRGVGMDIVRNNIQRINGNITVDTTLGKGTQFQVSLPLTLAIVPTMLVDLGGTTFAFPLVMVAEILRLECKDIQYIRERPVTYLRDAVLPLVNLGEVFGFFDGEKKETDLNYVVVVYYGKVKAGIIVDGLLGQEEVVVKSLGTLIGDLPGISSAAILGDGRVALIIDVPGLLKLSTLH
jgi:two-component system chemotaxis sensor kinase CheA